MSEIFTVVHDGMLCECTLRARLSSECCMPGWEIFDACVVSVCVAVVQAEANTRDTENKTQNDKGLGEISL